ncbi:hypothetical protein EMCRGX_G000488 [Ephydatia muelleri]
MYIADWSNARGDDVSHTSWRSVASFTKLGLIQNQSCPVVELVVPSTYIPNILQVSFRGKVCTSQCWSNNSIIYVINEWT